MSRKTQDIVVSPQVISFKRGMQQIRMAWIVFVFVLLMVTAFTILVIYCIIRQRSGGQLASSVGLDGLFGWSLRRMIQWLFESEKVSTEAAVFTDKTYESGEPGQE